MNTLALHDGKAHNLHGTAGVVQMALHGPRAPRTLQRGTEAVAGALALPHRGIAEEEVDMVG